MLPLKWCYLGNICQKRKLDSCINLGLSFKIGCYWTCLDLFQQVYIKYRRKCQGCQISNFHILIFYMIFRHIAPCILIWKYNLTLTKRLFFIEPKQISSKLLPYFDYNTTRIQPEYSQNTTRIQPEYNLNTTRIQPEYDQNTTRIQPEYNQNRTRIQPEYNQNTTRIQPEYDQNTTRIQPEYDQNTTRIQPEYDQNTTRIWPEHNQNTIKILSEYIKNTALSPFILIV